MDRGRNILRGSDQECLARPETAELSEHWMPDRGKGLPREWISSGKEIKIEGAPTRWGKVNFRMISEAGAVRAKVELKQPGAPEEIQVKIRLPRKYAAREVRVNGQAATFGGVNNDTVIINTHHERQFEIVIQFS